MYGVDVRKPGAQEYYDSVFALLASWGVDFVKMDDMAPPYDATRPTSKPPIVRLTLMTLWSIARSPLLAVNQASRDTSRCISPKRRGRGPLGPESGEARYLAMFNVTDKGDTKQVHSAT